jgi:hypothetical protein
MVAFGGGGGGRWYSSYSFLTSALDGGEWSASHPSCTLPPGKGPPVPIGQEAGWVPEPVWMQGLEEKSCAPVRDQTPIVQPVVRHYTAWATAAPRVEYNNWQKTPSEDNCVCYKSHPDQTLPECDHCNNEYIFHCLTLCQAMPCLMLEVHWTSWLCITLAYC